MEKFFESKKNYQKPILHPFFYNHKDTRKKCVETYFNDLANEEGNEDFKTIIEYIRDVSNFPSYLRVRRLKPREYHKFLIYFLENKAINLNSKTKNDIEEVLKVNGAISIHYENENKKIGVFAYLYKYYLNLKG